MGEWGFRAGRGSGAERRGRDASRGGAAALMYDGRCDTRRRFFLVPLHACAFSLIILD